MCVAKAMFNDLHDAARRAVVLLGWRPLPWVSGLIGVVLAQKTPIRTVFQMITVVTEPVAQPSVLRPRLVAPVRGVLAVPDIPCGGAFCGSAADQTCKRRRTDDQPGDDVQRRFDEVTAAWANFLQNNVGLHVTTFGKQVIEAKAVESFVKRVRILFAAKAASTLDKRLCSLRLHHTWCVSSCFSPFPVEGENANKYLLHCSYTTATRGATFRSGLAFVGGYLGLPGVDQILSSRRCEGAMYRG